MKNLTDKYLKYLVIVSCALLVIANIYLLIFSDSEKISNARVLGTADFDIAYTMVDPGFKPYIYAQNYLLIDGNTHYPLIEYEAGARVPFASITKLMTALVTIENNPNLDKVVSIQPEDTNVVETTMGLFPGEQITLRDLLAGMLIKSGNDAAYALARETGGSLPEFSKLMDKKGAELGMKSTNFIDPAGLDDNALSTAYDLANLAVAASNNKTITGFTSLPELTVTSTDGTLTHELKNSNRLVTNEMPLGGTFGLKTGFTPAAGHSLVTAAKREDRLLVSVVLHTVADTVTASAEESSKLLTWGFSILR